MSDCVFVFVDLIEGSSESGMCPCCIELRPRKAFESGEGFGGPETESMRKGCSDDGH